MSECQNMLFAVFMCSLLFFLLHYEKTYLYYNQSYYYYNLIIPLVYLHIKYMYLDGGRNLECQRDSTVAH